MKEEDLKKCCEVCKNENNCEHKNAVLLYNFIVCPFLQHKEYEYFIVVPARHIRRWWTNPKENKSK